MDLEDVKAGEMAMPHAHCCKGSTSQGLARELYLVVKTVDLASIQTLQLTTQAQNQGYVLTSPNIHFIHDLL